MGGHALRRALLFAALLGGCVDPRTEVVVVVNTEGLTIGTDIDALHLVVRDPSDSGPPRFERMRLKLCGSGETSGCFPLPLVLTLVPGPEQPHDTVLVDVYGLRRDEQVIGDAATFQFLPGVRQRLDFILYANCLNVDCSVMNQACDVTGKCVPIGPTPFSGGLALDGGARDGLPASGDLAGYDFSGYDLTPPPRDFAGMDLATSDLRVPLDLQPSWDFQPPLDFQLPLDFRAPLDFSPEDAPTPLWIPLTSNAAGKTLRAIWGTSESNLFAVGDNGTIVHSTDGVSWGGETSNTGENLNAVWGDAGGIVYAAGTNGALIQRTGGIWGPVAPNPWGTATVNLRGLSGSTASAFFTTGSGQTIGSTEGGPWAQICGDGTQTDSFHGISAPNGRVSAFIVGAGEVVATLSLPPPSCSPSPAPPGPMGPGPAPPSLPTGPSGPTGPTGPTCPQCPLQTIHTGANDLFGVGAFLGGVFAVGAGGTVLACAGSSCASMNPSPPVSNTLYGVWAESNGSRVFVVGDTGVILSRIQPSTGFSSEPSGTTQTLLAAFGFDGGAVFAVGTNGVILKRP
jgi:hypothetical protein